MRLLPEELLRAGVALLWVVGSLRAEGVPAPQPAAAPAPGVQAEVREPVVYEVDFAVVVTAPYHTHQLKVWLPLPPSDEAQQVSDRRLATFPVTVTPRIERESVYGNEFAYFEFVEPHGAQIIRHQFRARVCEVRWHVEPARVAAPSQWPANFEPYLRTPTALTTDGGFQDVLRTIVPERQGAARDLAATLQWVDQHLRYDHVNASLRADALFAFRNRCGHCSDYHGLCAAMGRALGYPTRVAYGLNLFPKNSPSHCKLEAYLPPYGWVSFDVSETQRLIEAIRKDPKLDTSAKERLCLAARQRLLSGFRDNTWLRVTQGSDYDLAPPASQRVAVVRTIYAEADGVPLPDPDPANPNQREFSWMTVHDYKADRAVAYPFKAWQTLDGAK